jgi:hypothetical protein
MSEQHCSDEVLEQISKQLQWKTDSQKLHYRVLLINCVIVNCDKFGENRRTNKIGNSSCDIFRSKYVKKSANSTIETKCFDFCQNERVRKEQNDQYVKG